MPKYIVAEGPLDHDGKRFETLAEVDLTEEQAASLAGIVKKCAEQGISDEELIEKIREAQSVEAVDELVGKIKRKAVVDAAAARKIELAG